MRYHTHLLRQITDWFNFIRNPHFGDYDTNYTEFEEDGTLVQYGEATTWEDIQTSLVGKRLSQVSGKVAYNYPESSVTFSNGGSITNDNDVVGMNVQLPHKTKVGSEMRLHLHWWQTDSTTRQWTVQHRIQNNNAAKATSWTTTVVDSNTNNAFTYTSGTLNQITSLVAIDITGYSISSVIQIRLTRSDAVAGTVDATFLDFHYEADTLGSNQEFIK